MGFGSSAKGACASGEAAEASSAATGTVSGSDAEASWWRALFRLFRSGFGMEGFVGHS